MLDIKKGQQVKIIRTSLKDYPLLQDRTYTVQAVEYHGIFVLGYNRLILHSDYEKLQEDNR